VEQRAKALTRSSVCGRQVTRGRGVKPAWSQAPLPPFKPEGLMRGRLQRAALQAGCASPSSFAGILTNMHSCSRADASQVGVRPDFDHQLATTAANQMQLSARPATSPLQQARRQRLAGGNHTRHRQDGTTASACIESCCLHIMRGGDPLLVRTCWTCVSRRKGVHQCDQQAQAQVRRHYYVKQL
jgi:hypothetical protein